MIKAIKHISGNAILGTGLLLAAGTFCVLARKSKHWRVQKELIKENELLTDLCLDTKMTLADKNDELFMLRREVQHLKDELERYRGC